VKNYNSKVFNIEKHHKHPGISTKKNLLLLMVPGISDVSKAAVELLHRCFHHLDPGIDYSDDTIIT